MEQFGAYRVISLLGEGGMGAVYLGEHALIGRRAAIKVLRAEFSQRADVVERFFNEARAASSVADLGIVQIFDFGYEDTTAYIVMEYLEGESLDARLERYGRLAADEVARIGRQLALSLHAAHACGVIHRDLKPENVFLVADAEVAGGERTKILDFGIAKLSDDKRSTQRTQAGLVFGTPLYMSPEQCRGSGEVDGRSDIYALGCVLFHLACGRPPFDAEGAGELLAMHLREAPPSPRELVEIPPYLEDVLLRCLEKTPEHRFASMLELASALVEPLVVARRKRRWPLALAGVVGAGAVAGALVLGGEQGAPAVPAVPVALPQASPAAVEPPHVVQPANEPEPPPPREEPEAARAPATPKHPHAHRAADTGPVTRPQPQPVTHPEPIATPPPTPKPEPAPRPEPAAKPRPAPLPDDPYGDR